MKVTKWLSNFLVTTEWQLRQLSFVLFLGLEGKFWCQLKMNGKITTLFYCADGFHFGKFWHNNWKICISRPLGIKYLLNKAKNHWNLATIGPITPDEKMKNQFHDQLLGSGEDFYHIWAWRPSWSYDHDHLKKLLFPWPMEAPYKIWLQLAHWLLRRCLKM